MATIPMYTQQTQASGGLSVSASAESMGAGVGQALGNVAGGIAQVGDAVQRRDNENAAAYTANAMSSAQIQWMAKIEKDKASAPLGAPNFAGKQLEEFEDFKSKQIEKAPNATSKKFLAERLEALKLSVYGNAVAFEAQQGVHARNLQWDETEKNIASLAAANPDQAKIALAESEATLKASEHQAAAQERLTRMRKNVVSSAVLGMVERSPQATLNDLNRYFGLPPTAPKPVVTPAEASFVDEDPQAAQKRAQDSPSRIPVLMQEIANPETPPKERERLQAEVERLRTVAQSKEPAGTTAADGTQSLPPVEVTGSKGSYWVDQLDPATAWTMRQRAMTEVQRGSAVLRQRIEDADRAAQAMAAQGVEPPDGFVPGRAEREQAYGLELGAKSFQQAVEVGVLGKGIKAMSTAGPAERQELLAQAVPLPGEDYDERQRRFNLLRQAAADVEKALKDDPARYVMVTSPRVKEAFDAAQSNPMLLQQYATESIAEQKRMGVVEPKVLTGGQADDIARQFSDPATGGANSAKLVESLAQQYGPLWPKVYGQLARDDKMPASAVVIPNMKDAGSKERLARLSTVKEDELKKLLEAGDAKDIDDKMLDALAPFWNTLAPQGGGNKTYETFRSQAAKLAYNYRSQGLSVKDSVNKAADEVANWQYQFEPSYRVPKVENPDQVIGGVRLMKRSLETLDIAAPASGLLPGQTKEQWVDAAKANLVPVTNADETGVIFYVQSSQGLVPLRHSSGQQVTRTWQQLRDEWQEGQGAPSFNLAAPKSKGK
jgi:hypothetical protein